MIRSSILTLALFAAPAAGQTWWANFDLPSGTSMGPDWQETAGDMAITSGEGHGNLNAGWSKMVHQHATGSYADAHMEITLRPPTGTSGPHVALVCGDGGSRNLYTKIQDNDSNGTYDRIYFYSDDNGTSYGSSSVAVSPFSAGRVAMYFTNNGDTLIVEIDVNFDGVADTQASSSGILSFAASLGTGFAVGTWAMGTYDEWSVSLPPTMGLFGSPAQLSLSSGGVQALTLAAPAPQAGVPYLLLGTLSGTAPGVPVDGLVLPLNLDAYMLVTLNSPNQPPLAGSFGTLDAQAAATASFSVPGGSNPAWAGAVFDHAFVAFDPVTLNVAYVSNAVSATLAP